MFRRYTHKLLREGLEGFVYGDEALAFTVVVGVYVMEAVAAAVFLDAGAIGEARYDFDFIGCRFDLSGLSCAGG